MSYADHPSSSNSLLKVRCARLGERDTFNILPAMADAKLSTTPDITFMSSGPDRCLPAVKVRNLNTNTKSPRFKETTLSQHEARTRGRLDAG